MKKTASAQGTENFAKRFSGLAEKHFREVKNLRLSSIGIGTYLGNWDEETDASYVDSIIEYADAGGNVIDTAGNYRFQRSERNIGAALEKLFADGFSREEFFVATKAGFLPFDGEPPTDVRGYFEKNFVEKGIAKFDDLIGGSHIIAPAYLQSQIDQSLENMRLEAIDLFYLHNPETQLKEIDKYTFEAKIAKAFEKLEENRQNGKIKFYGAATWNGFRVAPDDQSYHSLERFVKIAEQIAGEDHGFKFVQMPLNLAMPEAHLLKNQAVGGKVYTALEVANELGVSVMCSASILQGKIAQNVPLYIREILGNPTTDAMSGIQFVRSTPFVTTALVGMSNPRHVAENMELAKIEPVTEEKYSELFTQPEKY